METKNRLQETAQKAGNAVKEIATRAIHSAQETAQKVIDRTKEVAATAGHRREERTDQADKERKRE